MNKKNGPIRVTAGMNVARFDVVVLNEEYLE